ncbi:uncharacterized protein LOC120838782 [Ixodes scapularis]|uniref:uncharacterized protein LOC120838782 n=1 Tax=Ixodes scapularis TaxID=6945 RepID=UPI001A9F7FB2|nr:uncharacterized protein LOC120838782 [Ixodes scapularis]
MVEFFLPRGTILVCCVYCPPSSREKAYRLLDSSLEAAASKPYVNILIFGDFNCHVDWCSHEVPVPRDNTDDVLLETTTAAGLVQVCQQPSYTSREGVPSFLDLVFTSDATRIELVETSEGLHGSDHLAVELRYAVSLPRTGHHALRLWRFRQLDFGHMAQLAHLTPWCMTTTGSDWSSNYDLWCDFMFAIQKECVPCSTHSSKRKRLPWITPDIIKAARTKQILFRRARRSHCPAALRLAKEHQRTLKAAIYVSHQQYVRDIAERAKTDPKVFWTFISQLRSTSQRPSFTISGRAANSPQEIANLFADHFASINNNSPPPSSSGFTAPNVCQPELPAPRPLPVYADDVRQELSRVLFSEKTLQEALAKIKNSCSPGPDGVAPIWFKLFCSHVLPTTSSYFRVYWTVGSSQKRGKKRWSLHSTRERGSQWTSQGTTVRFQSPQLFAGHLRGLLTPNF